MFVVVSYDPNLLYASRLLTTFVTTRLRSVISADKITVVIIQKTFKILKGPFILIPAIPPYVAVSNFLDCARACLNSPICIGFNFVDGRCYMYTGYSHGGPGTITITIYVKIGSRPQISGFVVAECE